MKKTVLIGFLALIVGFIGTAHAGNPAWERCAKACDKKYTGRYVGDELKKVYCRNRCNIPTHNYPSLTEEHF